MSSSMMAGMSVRCVSAFGYLQHGHVYSVACSSNGYLKLTGGGCSYWSAKRFVPASRLDAIVFTSLRSPLRKGEHDDVND